MAEPEFRPEASGSEPESPASDADEDTTRKLTDLGDCLTDDSAMAQYMHGDLYTNLSRLNPLRWSSLDKPEQVADALDQQQQVRKVLLRVAASKQTLHKMFPSPAGAAVWLRKKFVRSRDLAELDEERLCVICLTQPRNVLLMPCRHAVLCEECLEVIMQRRPSECPICRRELQRKHTSTQTSVTLFF